MGGALLQPAAATPASQLPCTAACLLARHPRGPTTPVLQETGPPTPLLDTINFPVHLKNLGITDLKKLCKELRAGEGGTVACSAGSGRAGVPHTQCGLP